MLSLLPRVPTHRGGSGLSHRQPSTLTLQHPLQPLLPYHSHTHLHSWRYGRTTVLAREGAPEAAIKASDRRYSSAYLKYIWLGAFVLPRQSGGARCCAALAGALPLPPRLELLPPGSLEVAVSFPGGVGRSHLPSPLGRDARRPGLTGRRRAGLGSERRLSVRPAEPVTLTRGPWSSEIALFSRPTGHLYTQGTGLEV